MSVTLLGCGFLAGLILSQHCHTNCPQSRQTIVDIEDLILDAQSASSFEEELARNRNADMHAANGNTDLVNAVVDNDIAVVDADVATLAERILAARPEIVKTLNPLGGRIEEHIWSRWDQIPEQLRRQPIVTRWFDESGEPFWTLNPREIEKHSSISAPRILPQSIPEEVGVGADSGQADVLNLDSAGNLLTIAADTVSSITPQLAQAVLNFGKKWLTDERITFEDLTNLGANAALAYQTKQGTPEAQEPVTDATSGTTQAHGSTAGLFSPSSGSSVLAYPGSRGTLWQGDIESKTVVPLSEAAILKPAYQERDELLALVEELISLVMGYVPSVGHLLASGYLALNPERTEVALPDGLIERTLGNLRSGKHWRPNTWERAYSDDGWSKYLQASCNARAHASNGNTDLSDKVSLGKRVLETGRVADTTEEISSAGLGTDLITSTKKLALGMTRLPVMDLSAEGMERKEILSDLITRLREALMPKNNNMNSRLNGVVAAFNEWTSAQTVDSALLGNVSYGFMCSFFENALGSYPIPLSTSTYSSTNWGSVVSPTRTGLSIRGNWTKTASTISAAMASSDLMLATQILRVVNQNVNGNAIAQMVSMIKDRLFSGTIGSFASVLLRAFLYCYTLIPLFGSESFIPGFYLNLPSTLSYISNNLWWPLSPGFTTTQPVIPCVMCNFTQFCSYIFGTNSVWDPLYAASLWGSIAVIPITREISNNPAAMMAWIAMHLEAPYTDVYYLFNVQAVGWTGSLLPSGRSAANHTRVPGPMAGVILVLVDNSSIVVSASATQTVKVGTQNNNVTIDLYANSVAVATATPVDIGTVFNYFMNSVPDQLTAWPRAIDTWCKLYGNSNDFKAALLAAADGAHSIAPPIGVSTGGPIGTANAYTSQTDFNGAGFSFPAGAAGAQAYASGITGPWNMLLTVSNGSSAEWTKALLNDTNVFLGPYDPECAVAMAAGLIMPAEDLEIGSSFETVAGVCFTLRSVARVQSLLFDEIARGSDLSMTELFVGVGAANAYPMARERSFKAWTAIYHRLNSVIRGLGVTTLEYLPGPIANGNNTYFTPMAAANYVMGWSRIPRHILGYLSIDPGLPTDCWIGKLGDIMTVSRSSLGAYLLLKKPAPRGHRQGTAWAAYGMTASLSVANRFVQSNMLNTFGNATPLALCWGTSNPAITNSLQAMWEDYTMYGNPLSSIDFPLASPVPATSSYLQGNVYLGWYGSSTYMPKSLIINPSLMVFQSCVPSAYLGGFGNNDDDRYTEAYDDYVGEPRSGAPAEE